MKAEEVRRRYAAGERNFSGADLRGHNFKGQDLSGANFSHADIRGANFTEANLNRANFTGVKAGLPKRSLVIQLLLVLLISALVGVLQGYFGYFLYFYFPKVWDSEYSRTLLVENLAVIVSYLISIVATYTAIIYQGFTLKAFVVIAIAGVVAVAVAVGSALIGAYVSRQAIKGDERFALVRTIGVAFGAIGGTTFYKADLTNANFTGATLKSTHLRQANLTRVCWKDAQKLDRARVGDSILANAGVRSLLATRNGYKRSLVDANLRGANLDGVNLNEANLKWADLSGASLRQADLRDANLAETLAVEADFTGASLTGACLQAWNIDHTTILENIDCQFVFLLERSNEWGDRERRPHDPNKVFAPGDFKKLFREVMDTVQLLLRNGCDPDAFAAAFANIMQEHPGVTRDSIQGFEKRDDDLLVTIAVPKGIDKGQFEHDFETIYQTQLEAAKNAALLDAEQHHNETMEKMTIALASNLGSLLSHLTINTTAMNNNPNISSGSGSFINTGDITGSTINLGQISGTVTNAINQLPASAEGDRLKELLVQLQAAIVDDPQLPNDDKQTALEQVKELAAAGQEPNLEEKRSIGKRAAQMLKGIAASLPDAAKLVEACGKLLPLILPLVGL